LKPLFKIEMNFVGETDLIIDFKPENRYSRSLMRFSKTGTRPLQRGALRMARNGMEEA